METINKLFSVIVPVYNVREYLAECLDSLLQQTWSDYEIVVVDDCSTDGSADIAGEYARRYADRVRLVPHSVNKGLGGARNTGLEAARGQYLLFVDSDDYLDKQSLEKIAVIIEEEKPDVVEFCYEYVSEEGAYLRRTSIPASVYDDAGEELSLLTRAVNATNKAFRAELFRDTGIRFPEKRYYEDYWTVPKILLGKCRCVTLDAPLYAYRQRTSSIIHDTNIEKSRDIMDGTDELLAFFARKGDSARFLELEYLAVRNVLYHTTLRVNGIDRRSPMQRELKNYMVAHFPKYMENPYLTRLTRKERRLLEQIHGEKYESLYLTYHGVNKVKGTVKRVLHALGAEKLIRRISGK